MKVYSVALDKLTGALFFVGFVTSKFRSIPNLILSSTLSVISLAAYCLGYVVWYVGAGLYPAYPEKPKAWYGFAQFKDQYQMAAFVGLLAAIACIVYSPLIVPTAWLYTLSNVIWSISEYHKKKNPPPNDPQYSDAQQALYLRYTALVTVTSATTAIAATMVLFLPLMAPFIIAASSILAGALMIVALYALGQSSFGPFPSNTIKHNYCSLPKTFITSTPTTQKNIECLPVPAPSKAGKFFDNKKAPIQAVVDDDKAEHPSSKFTCCKN